VSGEIEATRDISTGGIFARAVEPSAGEATQGAHGSGACLNCGTTLTGEFCHMCGQSADVHRNLNSIGHDLLHGVFHFEGKIWTTLPMLFTRPGELTRRYIAGERAKFVSPLALFLFSVFLLFATFEMLKAVSSPDLATQRTGKSLTPVGLKADLKRAEAKEKKLAVERAAIVARRGDTEALDVLLDDVRADLTGLRNAKAVFEGRATDAVKGLRISTRLPWLDQRVAHATKEPKLFLYKLQSSAYKYSWVLILISTPFIWLLFAFRRDVGLYEHAIFAIYSLSAMSIGAVALSIAYTAGIIEPAIGTVALFGPPFHMYRQLRGAYGIGRFSAIWRTTALLCFSLIAGLLFFTALLGMAS